MAGSSTDERLIPGRTEEDWELAAFVTDLTDERYRISGNASSPAFGVAESSYGRLREWGAALVRRF